MSITGSLMGYENNNEVNQIKCSRKMSIKTLPMVSTTNNSTISSSSMAASSATVMTTSTNTTTTLSNSLGGKSHKYTKNVRSEKRREQQQQQTCNRGHANGLWSVWYGVLVVTLQAYIATRCAKRFVAYLSLPWPTDAQPPKFELHACIVLTGTGVLLLPILLAAAFLKLGNLANDGVKLGQQTSSILSNTPEGAGLANNLWKHGGPTAAFVHLCTAMCFLLPSLLMEARLIHAGFLPKDAIWRTDLDWVVIHRDRLVFFSFMNPPRNLSDVSISTAVTSSSLYEDQTFIEDSIRDGGPEVFDEDEDWRREKAPTTTEIPSLSLNIAGQLNTRVDPPVTVELYKTLRPLLSLSTIGINNIGKKNNTAKVTQRSRGRTTGFRSSGIHYNQHNNMTGHSLPLTINSLTDLDHPEHLNLDISDEEAYTVSQRTISLEYLNYAMALGVYSVRYPAVFWSCNKALGTVFSVQLVMNSAQSLLTYTGMSVLYKVQVVGAHKVLPQMRQHRPSYSSGSYTSGIQRVVAGLFGDNSHFLLNPHVTLVLFGLSSLLVLCSSLVTYLYAYGRFVSFLEQERARRIIMSKEGRSGWAYFTHCAALCVFLALAICHAPLLYDYTVVYRGSLDGVMLACILGLPLHLLLSIVLWFFLTIKRRWIFKVRVTIARATVRSARSVKLVTDVDLLACRTKSNNEEEDEDEEDPDNDHDGGTSAPLLIVGDGKTYSIADASPKRAIMNVIQKAVMERKTKRNQGEVLNRAADSEEQIYWLRPKLRPSPAQSPTNDHNGSTTLDKSWLNKKLRPKVTFTDLPSTSGPRNKGKRRGNTEGGPDDDGDYATLRELPLMATIDSAEDSTSEENKLLECITQVTYYASGNRDLHPSSEGDPSPLLTPEPLPDPNISSVQLASLAVSQPSDITVLPIDGALSVTNVPLATHSLLPQQPIHIPRCLRQGEEDQLTPRSDSSNSSSTAVEPPNPIITNSYDLRSSSTEQRSNTSSNSDSSSGVHSNISTNGSHHSQSTLTNHHQQRRATSVDDLTAEIKSSQDGTATNYRDNRDENHWRSCSLQRGTVPPTSRDFTPKVALLNPLPTSFTPKFVNIETAPSGCPAIILESTNESTVVIRRRSSRPKLTDPLNPNDPEPFSRSTNMRMTSFTEVGDFRNGINGIHASSATLPHYPTQPVVPAYPNCSTMPLPHGMGHSGANSAVGYSAINGSTSAGGSCASVPLHACPPPPLPQNNINTVIASVREHTTLPSHHNGMKLGNNGNGVLINNVNIKRFQPTNHVLPPQSQQWSLPSGHHTFPQPLQNKFFNGATALGINSGQDRDSANFSMASSGDSDICMQPH